MTLLDLKGRPRPFPYRDYLVDWDKVVGSKVQKRVKDWMRPYWERDTVLEEARLPGPERMRFDLYNVTKSIVIEVSPGSTHSQFNSFFHGSLAGFRAVIKRDLEKDRFCALNGLTLVHVYDKDLPLTEAFFKQQYNLDL